MPNGGSDAPAVSRKAADLTPRTSTLHSVALWTIFRFRRRTEWAERHAAKVGIDLPPTEFAVEFVQQSESSGRGTLGCEGTKPNFGIMLG